MIKVLSYAVVGSILLGFQLFVLYFHVVVDETIRCSEGQISLFQCIISYWL